jgi:hypothetical protein
MVMSDAPSNSSVSATNIIAHSAVFLAALVLSYMGTGTIKDTLGHLQLLERSGVLPAEDVTGRISASQSREVRQVPNIEALMRLKLSRYPSDEEVRTFIEAVLASSADHDRRTKSDPQVVMLGLVAENHLPVVLEYWKKNPNLSDYFLPVVQLYTRPEYRDLIVSHLRSLPKLAGVARHMGWQAQAYPELLHVLESKPRQLDTSGVSLLLEVGGQAAAVRLISLIESGSYVHKFYQLLKPYNPPGLSDALINAWAATKQDKYARAYLAQSLLEQGYQPALDYVVDHLVDNNGLPATNFSAINLYSRYVEGPVGVKAAQDWYMTHRDNLAFNSVRMRFVVRGY